MPLLQQGEQVSLLAQRQPEQVLHVHAEQAQQPQLQAGEEEWPQAQARVEAAVGEPAQGEQLLIVPCTNMQAFLSHGEPCSADGSRSDSCGTSGSHRQGRGAQLVLDRSHIQGVPREGGSGPAPQVANSASASNSHIQGVPREAGSGPAPRTANSTSASNSHMQGVLQEGGPGSAPRTANSQTRGAARAGLEGSSSKVRHSGSMLGHPHRHRRASQDAGRSAHFGHLGMQRAAELHGLLDTIVSQSFAGVRGEAGNGQTRYAPPRQKDASFGGFLGLNSLAGSLRDSRSSRTSPLALSHAACRTAQGTEAQGEACYHELELKPVTDPVTHQ